MYYQYAQTVPFLVLFVVPSFIVSWFCRMCGHMLMKLTFYQSEILGSPTQVSHFCFISDVLCRIKTSRFWGGSFRPVFWLLVVFAMLIVIYLVFIASWAFSPRSMYVNLLWFSTFHCSFCFHAAPVVSFCGLRYLVWLLVNDVILYMAKFCYYVLHTTRQVPTFWIYQITRFYLYWPKFVQVIFCFRPYSWAVKLIRRVLHLGISFICWFRGIRVLPVFFGVFLTEEVDGVGGNGPGDSTVVDVQILLEAFLNVSLRYTYFDEYFFFYKTKFLVLGLPA